MKTVRLPSASIFRFLLLGLVILYVLGLHAIVGVVLSKTDLTGRIHKKWAEMPIFPKYAGTALPIGPALAPVAVKPSASASASAPTGAGDLQGAEKELSAIVERDLFVYALSTQLALKGLIPADPIFFVGDSLIRGMNVRAVVDSAVNFGIAGDNTAGIRNRVKIYTRQISGFDATRFLVLAVGINNLGIGAHADMLVTKHLQELLVRRPRNQRVVLNAIFPVDETIKPAEFAGFNKRIITINRSLRKMCNRIQSCVFMDVGKNLSDKYGNLAKKYHLHGDPIHLSQLAYSLWEQELRLVLNG